MKLFKHYIVTAAILAHLHIPVSLAVVENLREKNKGEFVYSFSESVHPIVPQKKNPHELALGNFFTAL